jgi:hypothetical protein
MRELRLKPRAGLDLPHLVHAVENRLADVLL